MTGGTRIVAIESTAPEGAAEQGQTNGAEDAPLALEEDWDEQEPAPLPRNWGGIIAAALALVSVVGWSAAFASANWVEMAQGGSLGQWTVWIRDWSIPVLLIGVVWLIAMRNSRAESLRFAATARSLGEESRLLEVRLTTVNRELSLAREFLGSQSRELESMGRVATERLSKHSDKLASLIHDNGARVEAIGAVSTAALENMEKLRGQLPVIASSAKDVTNNIANAGRTAHAQIEEMIAGFSKLNQFGQASERQVLALRTMVDETLAEFTRQSQQLDTIATERFAALADRGAEFRTQLDAQEVEALAAIRNRAKAMADELEEARKALDEQEAESLTSLRARLGSVRDESAAIGRSLREGEGVALDAWRQAVARLEEDLRQAVATVGEIDEKALESARKRLAALADEANEVDARMAERDRVFAEEIARRRADFVIQHEEFSQSLVSQMVALENEISQRRGEQENHARELAIHSEAITARLGDFSVRMAEIVQHGSSAEAMIGASLATLAEKLVSSRDALSGTDKEIAALTDSSVRLLELIQASVQHSSQDLPKAIDLGEARLAAVERRAIALRDTVDEAHSRGEALSGYVLKSSEDLGQAILQTEQQTASLEAMRQSLEALREESAALAANTQGELTRAIEQLSTSARDAVSGIGEMSAASIQTLAERLGEESGAAIDKAMRSRAAEVAGQLEQAAAQAAGVSREAALQLRDQLAKVNELAGNLERRVAQARARAEEQVDNDFARRVALITESLNSNAIDIARAMDTDVTDTAWAAYLKGDRGIFTRRAVKLLEAGEAKAVAQLYEDDRAFGDHVSRYIHDFEAMLRQLLSTRDGHALGVTLLSSDMGKLYVALAQAIERLRN